VNPIHVDALYARRTPNGVRLVHGMHSLLAMLEAAKPDMTASTVRVRFAQPVYVGDTGRVAVAKNRISLQVDGIDAVIATIRHGVSDSGFPRPPESWQRRTIPIILTPDEMRDRAGYFGILPSDGFGSGRWSEAFPVLADSIDGMRVVALGSLSYLVGMLVPGMHSLFLALRFRLDPVDDDAMSFMVRSVDERYRIARIAFSGGGISGDLEALVRPAPVEQPSLSAAREAVKAGEVAGARALVVGGSRGLGEVAAKLLAAGGAEVTVTYARGRGDAERVAQEIGGRTVPYDALRDARRQIEACGDPTHVYYFATPPIFQRSAGLCDPARLAQFNAIYSTGFADLLSALLERWGHELRVFYPSSVAIDERPPGMTEYAMAKAAGEILCEDLKEAHPGLRLIVRRLPRLPTDQTASIAPLEVADPLEVMTPIVREMHSRDT
jgi:MaoC like domain/NAD dependent epimerase/dehydratase family